MRERRHPLSLMKSRVRTDSEMRELVEGDDTPRRTAGKELRSSFLMGHRVPLVFYCMSPTPFYILYRKA